MYIPQGLHISDLQLVVFSSMALQFAYDLKLISKTATNDLTRLQNDISNLHSWSVQNCLLSNYKKCSVITFSSGRNHEQQELMLGHNGTKHRSIARELGLEIEEHDGLNMSKR